MVLVDVCSFDGFVRGGGVEGGSVEDLLCGEFWLPSRVMAANNPTPGRGWAQPIIHNPWITTDGRGQ